MNRDTNGTSTTSEDRRVLVAEDDLTSRLMLSAMLKRWGYQPLLTEDGTRAWEALHHPDAPKLVLLDWSMPGLDGIELARRVRRQGGDEPPYLIMLTSKSQKGEIVEGLEAGANDYVAKPYDPEELRARLRVGSRILTLQAALADRMRQLEKALADVSTLRGIIPICASCKKIRDDKGYWNQVEAYVSSHSQAEFTHGFCPDCLKKLYGDYLGDAVPAGASVTVK